MPSEGWDPFNQREQREGRLTANRIGELVETGLPGSYDRTHLQAFHAYIFQDLPQYKPGIIRPDANELWMKYRISESAPANEGHRVFYAPRGVAALVSDALRRAGGIEGMTALDHQRFAEKMARLYGDLDYAHGFLEGNSRTLRAFTRQLAHDAGYRLDWHTTNVDAVIRDRLYAARDIAVLERHFPGLPATPEPGLSRNEMDAWADLQRLRADPSARLETIIRESSRPIAAESVTQAEARPPAADAGTAYWTRAVESGRAIQATERGTGRGYEVDRYKGQSPAAGR
ncbi:Fic family protein [Acidiphilium acidophilum]|uniref:Fic family protein n=1 Tax=Acidiphilium acidophilum TaxID=76588 RepID=UPI002E8E7824|nr:Fic family protein [Acidiphilium acidophilum]